MPPEGDADALRRALRAEALGYDVEGDGALAVLVPCGSAPPPLDAAARRHLVASATRAGFTHVALEVTLDGRADDAIAELPANPAANSAADPSANVAPDPSDDPVADPAAHPAPVPVENHPSPNGGW